MNTPRAVLAGTGIAVAENRVDNHMLGRILETDDAWIRERSGIATRYYADPDTSSSDLGADAGSKALAAAGIAPDEVDYVVCATMTPDHFFPGAGTLIQDKIGIPPCPALDLRQQCAGFAYGLQMVDSLVRSGIARTVLLVGTDVHSCLMPHSETAWDILYGRQEGPLDPEEFAWNSKFRSLYVLFGDAAGAMVFRADDSDSGRGILGSRMVGDGSHKEILYVPGGGSAYRPWVDQEMVRRGDTIPTMEGRTVFKLAVTKMPEITRELLGDLGYGLDDLDLLVMHQANLRINEAARNALGLAPERVHNNIETYGNTTSATLPLAFYEAQQAGKAPEGSLVGFTALGAGLHYGAVLLRV